MAKIVSEVGIKPLVRNPGRQPIDRTCVLGIWLELRLVSMLILARYFANRDMARIGHKWEHDDVIQRDFVNEAINLTGLACEARSSFLATHTSDRRLDLVSIERTEVTELAPANQSYAGIDREVLVQPTAARPDDPASPDVGPCSPARWAATASAIFGCGRTSTSRRISRPAIVTWPAASASSMSSRSAKNRAPWFLETGQLRRLRTRSGTADCLLDSWFLVRCERLEHDNAPEKAVAFIPSD